MMCWPACCRSGLAWVRVGVGDEPLVKLVLEGDSMLEFGVIMESGGVAIGFVPGGDV